MPRRMLSFYSGLSGTGQKWKLLSSVDPRNTSKANVMARARATLTEIRRSYNFFTPVRLPGLDIQYIYCIPSGQCLRMRQEHRDLFRSPPLHEARSLLLLQRHFRLLRPARSVCPSLTITMFCQEDEKVLRN